MIKKLNESIMRHMNIIKLTARGTAVCENVLYGFYMFCLSTAPAMDLLDIVFVSREEWSTSATAIETNYTAANLIPISLVESNNFFGAGYTTESQNFL